MVETRSRNSCESALVVHGVNLETHIDTRVVLHRVSLGSAAFHTSTANEVSKSECEVKAV